MGYIVRNPYGQPPGHAILSGVRRQELIDGKVNKEWFEGEIIPADMLTQRQIQHWLAQGILEEENLVEKSVGVVSKMTSLFRKPK